MMRDLRYAIRVLLRSPVVFLAAVIVLAVGIGANTTVFSAINHLLIRPLPFPHPEQLAIFGEINRERGLRSGVSRERFETWRTHARSFDGIAALWDDQTFPLAGTGESLHGARVSANFFDVLGARAALGRTFLSADAQPGAGEVVIISDEFWSTRWARDPGVLGRTLEMGGRKWTVVGVMPPGFRLLYSSASVWVPLEAQAGRGARALFAVGRLRSSEPLARATDELSSLRTASDDEWTAWGQPLREYIIGDRRPLAILLFVIVGVMLATACLNVGAVLIALATGRVKDVAIRVSLGATRWRILRDSLMQAAVLAALGSAGGLAFAMAIRRVAIAAVPELRYLTTDARVLAFASCLALFTTVVIASGPAMVSSGAMAAAAARKGLRLRGAFVVAQTALAVTMLVSVGVLVRSLGKLQAVEPGFRSAGVLVAEVDVPSEDAPAHTAAFVSAALEKAASQPYVRAAAAATAMPLFNPDRATMQMDGREGTFVAARRSISPEYFALFDIPVRRGRHFSAADRATAPPVAIVNERAAELFWPDGDVVGKRVRFGGDAWVTIVGVAANVHSLGLRRPPVSEVFLPFAQHPTGRVALALRVEGDPLAWLPALSELVSAADPRAAVTYANSMPALLDEQLALVRALSLFGAVFAALAVLLAGTGLYGAISCLYARRTNEIGIRIALGATPRGIIGMVAASSAKLAGAGCLAGIAAGAAAGRLFQAAVFGTGGVDLLVVAGAVGVTVLVVIAATYAPAARAAGIEPATAIRYE